MKKWFIIIVYVMMLYIAYINKEALLYWMNSEEDILVSYMLMLSTFLAIFPVIPFSLFAGIMGVKYGLVLGALINWFGSVVAATLYFLLTRYAFANYFRMYINRFKGLKKFTSMIERNTFLAVFFARIIPIVPPPVINIYSGISIMSFTTYFFCHSHWANSGHVIIRIYRRSNILITKEHLLRD